jgi:molecular chaperone DnaK
MNKEQVDQAVRDAEAHAAEDAAIREKAETKNSLDQLVFQVEKFSTENAEKLGEKEKSGLDSALAEAKEALQSDDAGRMKTAAESLTQAFQAAGTSMYAAEAAAAAEAGSTPGDGASGEASGSDYAGYDAPSANGSTPHAGDTVEGEVVEGEVESK